MRRPAGTGPRVLTRRQVLACGAAGLAHLAMLSPPPSWLRDLLHLGPSAEAPADTFKGDVYLIDRHSSEITLLTTDHKMTPDHAHPIFSPDNKRVLIQSGRLTDGASLDLMSITLPDSLVNRRTP